MAVTVRAVTVGVQSPPLVQVTVDGLMVGDTVRIVGVAGDTEWVPRGADIDEAASAQVQVLDNLAPLNAPIRYRVEVNGAVGILSDPVTVPYERDYVLTSLESDVVVPLIWTPDSGDARQVATSQHLTWVAGRRAPVVQYEAAGGESGAWSVVTETESATAALVDILAAGAPVILRTSGRLLDFPASQVVVLAENERTIVGRRAGFARTWSLSWVEIDDPLSATPIAGDTLADVDAAHTGDTLADLDTTYPGATFSDWNRYDWAGNPVS